MHALNFLSSKRMLGATLRDRMTNQRIRRQTKVVDEEVMNVGLKRSSTGDCLQDDLEADHQRDGQTELGKMQETNWRLMVMDRSE